VPANDFAGWMIRPGTVADETRLSAKMDAVTPHEQLEMPIEDRGFYVRTWTTATPKLSLLSRVFYQYRKQIKSLTIWMEDGGEWKRRWYAAIPDLRE
jgi:hypothetical protein